MKTNRRRFTAAAAAAPFAMRGLRPSYAAAQDNPTLALWLETTTGSDANDLLIEHIITPYNDRGGAQIEATVQANLWQSTQTALAGGAGPDIVVTPGPTFAVESSKAGQLLALDDYITRFNWKDRFVPWGLELGKVNDKVYSIPNEIETLVLFYNKSLFEEKGWTPPTTMEELITLADAVNAEGLIPFASSNAEWRPTNEHFIGEFLNHGPEGPTAVYKALIGELKWTDPIFVEALKPLNDFMTNGYFAGGLERYYTSSTDDVNASLAYGDSAMMITGTWFLMAVNTYFDESGMEWDWVPMPSASGEPVFDLGIGSTYSINAKTKYPDDVADYLDYYFSPETQATAKVKAMFNPGPVIIDPALLSDLDEREARVVDELSKASSAGNYGYTTWTFFPPRTEVFMYEEIEKVWAGDMTVEDYLKGAQDLFDQDLADGNIPPIPERS